MQKARLEDFHGGWFLGNFIPSMLTTGDFEIGLKRFSRGDREPLHYQQMAVEFTLVVSGRISMGGIEVGPNEILRIDPGERADFLALEDCVVVAVKAPSIPNDKFEVE